MKSHRILGQMFTIVTCC